MNRFRFTLLLLAVASLMAVSCEKPDPAPVVEYLEVNANNISGNWQLKEWNGNALTGDTYVYLNIVRNDKTYTMYQNLDSFSELPHVVTGRYNLDTDPVLGAIIRGNYDYDSGDWAHRYIIKNLTKDSMVWIAKDNAEFVQHFVRIESIPVADDKEE